VTWALAAWALAPAAARADDDNLDQALVKQAPKIIQEMRTRKYHTIGVLKFTVQKGKEAPSDNVGPLNLSIANRLTVALVTDPSLPKGEELGIIRNAGAEIVKAHNGRANHLTAAGRRACFDGRYHVAWGMGDAAVPADAFLTGVVELSPDLKQTTVKVQVFARDALDLDEVARFTVATDPRTLSEAGESYCLSRAAFGHGPLKQTTTVATAAAVKREKAEFPLLSKETPIVLEVRYDGEPVAITAANGQGEVPEPMRGQKITFVLKNRDKEKTYGIVLKVNGLSTYYKQRLDAFHCTKWILGPGKHIEIEGFQIPGGKAEQFEVLRPEQSEEEEVNYGEHTGTFTLVAFIEKSTKQEKPIILEDWAKRLAAVQRGELPADRPTKLLSLQEQLKANKDAKGHSQDTSSRGLIVPGPEIESPTNQVAFEADPTPVLVSTIRYYSLKGVKKVGP
jgi:hypothetical protein